MIKVTRVNGINQVFKKNKNKKGEKKNSPIWDTKVECRGRL
jgi:hypothetical protein